MFIPLLLFHSGWNAGKTQIKKVIAFLSTVTKTSSKTEMKIFPFLTAGELKNSQRLAEIQVFPIVHKYYYQKNNPFKIIL